MQAILIGIIKTVLTKAVVMQLLKAVIDKTPNTVDNAVFDLWQAIDNNADMPTVMSKADDVVKQVSDNVHAG